MGTKDEKLKLEGLNGTFTHLLWKSLCFFCYVKLGPSSLNLFLRS